jgi:hypothetical protein
MNERIQTLLDSRDLEPLEAADEEVLGMWRKAVRTFRSAAAAGHEEHPDSRFTLLYQSALQAGTAVVRAAGYRVRTADHHRTVFAAVVALASGALSRAAREPTAPANGQAGVCSGVTAQGDPRIGGGGRLTAPQ